MTIRQLDAQRTELPLYRLSEAARLLAVPSSTFGTWARGYLRHRIGHSPTIAAPVLCAVAGHDGPTVPFLTLAEGMVLAAIRRAGVPMQRIRPAILALQEEIGIEHALASSRLYTDGAELLYDLAERTGSLAETKELVVVRSGQRVFTEIVASYLTRITYGEDGYAVLLHPPAYGNREVVVDPTRSFGQPIFVSGGARVADVLDRFYAGESLHDVAAEFGVSVADLEGAVRVSSARAA